MTAYRLLDTGNEQKLEDLGGLRVVRQATQAHWGPSLPRSHWERVDAVHHRSRSGGGHWMWQGSPAEPRVIDFGGYRFKLELTDFGHIGLFPEQAENWAWLERCCRALDEPHVMNLFGYTGGSTLATARGGAKSTHVDASKGVVSWARENAALNQLAEAPTRWIVEDVSKYVGRERNRGTRYQGLVLDPPSFGRGPRGQVWKIEQHLLPFMHQLAGLTDELQLILLSCHTPGYSPLTLANVLHQVFDLEPGEIESGEMVVAVEESAMVLPSGAYARWCAAT